MTKFFNENIHALLEEVKDMTFPMRFYSCYDEKEQEKINFMDEEFREKHPYICENDERNNYFIKINDERILEEDYPYDYIYWLKGPDRLIVNTIIRFATLPLWIDYDKYGDDDDTMLFTIINEKKNIFYTTPLSKALVYYVTG